MLFSAVLSRRLNLSGRSHNPFYCFRNTRTVVIVFFDRCDINTRRLAVVVFIGSPGVNRCEKKNGRKKNTSVPIAFGNNSKEPLAEYVRHARAVRRCRLAQHRRRRRRRASTFFLVTSSIRTYTSDMQTHGPRAFYFFSSRSEFSRNSIARERAFFFFFVPVKDSNAHIFRIFFFFSPHIFFSLRTTETGT